MEVVKLITLLQAKKEFKDWHAKNKDAKLVHIFLMVEPGKETKFDIGFYDYKKQLMTSFVMDRNADGLEKSESKEVFSEDPQKIKPIEENRVKVLFDDAQKTAAALQKEKYRQHKPMKEIVILQNLPVGQVWNITYVTQQLETLNIKVDAESGKVVEDKLHKIFSM
ncbi:hypothetical protein KY363_02585 [Candidatus Woesearchaeota archaeon]|nr:hypothetical protein [Candidatus Woesearchaeota archaeon]